MADRELALFDLHRGDALPVSLAEELAGEGLVRIVSDDEHEVMVRHASLRERIDELENERHELRTQFTWPWRLMWRRRRIEEMGARLSELHAEARELRSRLHERGLARQRPRAYAELSDGRHAALTVEGTNRAYAWAHSRRFDPLIDPSQVRCVAEWCMQAYGRLLGHWRVAYPAPILATTAGMLCDAPQSERETALEKCVAVFDYWRRRLKTCPADRVLVAAPVALAARPDEEPAAAARRVEQCQERLRRLRFPRERETLWAAATLTLDGFRQDRLRRVFEVWKRLVTTGWSMGSSTYPYAARLTLAPGSPTQVGSRVERIHRELSERIFGTGRAGAAAASILGQSDFFPTERRSSARLMDARSVFADVVDRMMSLVARLPQPPEGETYADCRLPAAAILAKMPGSIERVWSAFERTLGALRQAAGDQAPGAGRTGVDPLTGAALLLCDRAWGGRASNRLFVFEACAACCNESWDDLTMFRLSAPGGPVWTKA
ncbi:MAG: hypothetical protein U9R79_22715 [Armatimonadota bacterium]|nr:hypothetical protein [Armatimonadota bacterium]